MLAVNINILPFRPKIDVLSISLTLIWLQWQYGSVTICKKLFLRYHALDMNVNISGLLSAAGKATMMILQQHLLTSRQKDLSCKIFVIHKLNIYFTSFSSFKQNSLNQAFKSSNLKHQCKL